MSTFDTVTEQYDRENADSQRIRLADRLPEAERIQSEYEALEKRLNHGMRDSDYDYLQEEEAPEKLALEMQLYRKRNCMALTWGWLLEMLFESPTVVQAVVLMLTNRVWEMSQPEETLIQGAVQCILEETGERMPKIGSQAVEQCAKYLPVLFQGMVRASRTGYILLALPERKEPCIQELLMNWMLRHKHTESMDSFVESALRKKCFLELQQYAEGGIAFWLAFVEGNSRWQTILAEELLYQLFQTRRHAKWNHDKFIQGIQVLVSRGVNLIPLYLANGGYRVVSDLEYLLSFYSDIVEVDTQDINRGIREYEKKIREENFFHGRDPKPGFIPGLLRILYHRCRVTDITGKGVEPNYLVDMSLRISEDCLVDLLYTKLIPDELIPRMIHANRVAGRTQMIPFFFHRLHEGKAAVL